MTHIQAHIKNIKLTFSHIRERLYFIFALFDIKNSKKTIKVLCFHKIFIFLGGRTKIEKYR
jgi:hypothetical protein